MNFVVFPIISICLEFPESIVTKHDTVFFFFFCKMVINKTNMIGIFSSNRNRPYEFNASIDF